VYPDPVIELGPWDLNWTHVATLLFGNTSVIVPPDTDRNAEPAKPTRKRKMRWTAMLLANAAGIERTVFS